MHLTANAHITSGTTFAVERIPCVAGDFDCVRIGSGLTSLSLIVHERAKLIELRDAINAHLSAAKQEAA